MFIKKYIFYILVQVVVGAVIIVQLYMCSIICMFIGLEQKLIKII